MSSMDNEPLKGQLSVVSKVSKLGLFESGDLTSTSVIIFVGGLTDGLGTVAYVPALSDEVARRGWELAQIGLSSAYTQFGMSSLEQDALEIGEAIDYLRSERGKKKIVLFGHSTGCQDAIHYLTVHPEIRPEISGAVLQAPVSDVEYFENVGDPTFHMWADFARNLVSEGKGETWLPKEASQSAAALGVIPFTAYRFASLFSPRGDDDFFSSNIPPTELKFRFSAKPLLLILCDADQSYPPRLSTREAKEELLTLWEAASEGKIVPYSAVIGGANHTVDDPAARKAMFELVVRFIESL